MIRSDRRRRGFTIAELVVVATIIVIAISLIVLGVVYSREQSRRNECVNKIRQLGIAIHNSSSNWRRSPPGSLNLAVGFGDPLHDSRAADSSGGKASAGYSWIVQILPHLEENELYSTSLEK